MTAGAGHVLGQKKAMPEGNGASAADAVLPYDVSTLARPRPPPAAPSGRGHPAAEPQEPAGGPHEGRGVTDTQLMQRCPEFMIYGDLDEPSGRKFLEKWRDFRTRDNQKLGLSDKDRPSRPTSNR